MRVYEIAREVGLPNKDLITKIRALGLEVNNHMSSLGTDDVDRVKRSIERERVANTVTKRLSSTVLRRRSKKAKVVPAPEKTPEMAAPAEEPRATQAAAPAPVRRARKKIEVVKEPEPLEAKPESAPVEVKAAPVEVKAEPAPAPRKIELDTAPKQAVAVAETPEAMSEPASETGEPDGSDDGTPRSQFERELNRARTVAQERDTQKSPRKEGDSLELSHPRPDGRPEVGSVISLPMTRIKITERAPTRTTPARQRFQPQQRRGGRRQDLRGKRRMAPGKKGKATQITTPAEHKRVIKIEDNIAVPDLAKHMGIKATEMLKKLWSMGMVGININAAIDFETANIIGAEFGYDVQNVAFQAEEVLTAADDSADDLQSRPAVVTVMGHVDHGKTTLLDTIRETRVAAGEAGGITQHIAAYRVTVPGLGKLVFLDTPGHAAFTAMRARGAQATDIVVLVVAADDGVMPQTVEAINHAKDAGVPIIIAVNKIDAKNAQPEKVRQQMAEHELIPEEWGGETQYVEISALKNQNIDKLIEAIGLQAEILELSANPNKPAQGVVIEARLDKSRGPVATVLVQQGTVKVGDIVVAGQVMGKIRAMLDDAGAAVKEGGPSTPVQLLGLDGVPDAGDEFHATDEKTAKRVVEHRRNLKRKKELAATSKMSLENIMAKIQDGQAKELKVVLKADVQGSAEAVREALQKLSTEKVSVKVIATGVGGITESDINLAKAGGAVIVGFHVRPAGKSAKLAEREGVVIKLYNIIYEALDEVKAAMAGLLAPIKKDREVGRLEVRQAFNISKIGTIAGCHVTEGKIQRKSLLRVIRDSVQVHEGKVAQLKRFKDDVSEVEQGYECGVQVEGFDEIQEGDIIEAYEIVEEAATL